MKQCLHITISLNEPHKEFGSIVQTKARSLGIEGTVQIISSSQFVIIGCGSRKDLDLLLDVLHQEFDLRQEKSIVIEPFLKTKDYRGVFRIIE